MEYINEINRMQNYEGFSLTTVKKWKNVVFVYKWIVLSALSWSKEKWG